MTWAVHISLAPTYFDPAETPGLITPFMVLYALHDALVKPMPGNAMAPSLAESWSLSKDALAWEFVLRRNVKFHNGETMTAEDVKFSFERYKGAGAKLLKDKVAAVEIVDPYRVRFRLKKPWPDFMTFYGTPATGAAWIVPKKYVEQVGDDGFKKHPDRRGTVQVRGVSSRRGADAGGPHRLLAQDAGRQDAGAEGDSRRGHPARRAQARRGGHGLQHHRTRWPRSSSGRPGSRSSRPTCRSRRGWCRSSSGIPSRRGMIAACAWRRTWPSTATASTRPPISGWPR